jgi:hypothetical protein
MVLAVVHYSNSLLVLYVTVVARKLITIFRYQYSRGKNWPAAVTAVRYHIQYGIYL